MRRFVKLRIADLIDSRETLLVAGIVADLRVVNGQRGRVAIFKLGRRQRPHPKRSRAKTCSTPTASS